MRIFAIKRDTCSAIWGAGLGATITVFYCCGWSLNSNKPHFSFTETILVEREEADLMTWIWVDNNGNDMNSEHTLQRTEQWNHRSFDLGRIRKHFREDPAWLRFQFSFPKPWLFFWISPHQNCTQTSRHHSNPSGLWLAFQELCDHVWRSPDQMWYLNKELFLRNDSISSLSNIYWDVLSDVKHIGLIYLPLVWRERGGGAEGQGLFQLKLDTWHKFMKDAYIYCV